MNTALMLDLCTGLTDLASSNWQLLKSADTEVELGKRENGEVWLNESANAESASRESNPIKACDPSSTLLSLIFPQPSQKSQSPFAITSLPSIPLFKSIPPSRFTSSSVRLALNRLSLSQHRDMPDAVLPTHLTNVSNCYTSLTTTRLHQILIEDLSN